MWQFTFCYFDLAEGDAAGSDGGSDWPLAHLDIRKLHARLIDVFIRGRKLTLRHDTHVRSRFI